MLTAHTHTNTCSERFYSGKLRLLRLAAGKKARRGFLSLSLSLPPSIFHRLGRSLPPNAGLRSHYLSLISVADSSGAVRDCLGRGEEERRRNEAQGRESERAPPKRPDRARDSAGFQVTLVQGKKNENVCGSG